MGQAVSMVPGSDLNLLTHLVHGEPWPSVKDGAWSAGDDASASGSGGVMICQR